MEALLVVDAQNEFSAAGLRAVPHHDAALAAIRRRIADARRDARPIAWVQHHNRPHESRAFVPGSWGAELSPGLGRSDAHGPERLFQKDVFGAFSGTALEPWLRDLGVTEVLIVGFYAHMCVSTSAREALVRGFAVALDPEATAAGDLEAPPDAASLGRQGADEVRRAALLHLVHMGATLAPAAGVAAPAPAMA